MNGHDSLLPHIDSALGNSALKTETAESVCDTEHCPRCGRLTIDIAPTFIGWRERAAAIALRFPVVCKSCGHRFALSVLSGDLEIVVPKKLATRAAMALLVILAVAFWLGMQVSSG